LLAQRHADEAADAAIQVVDVASVVASPRLHAQLYALRQRLQRWRNIASVASVTDAMAGFPSGGGQRMTSFPADTAGDVRATGPRIAVLPIGSFEQHGDHLPLATDSLIATLIAGQISRAYGLLLLPAITISCSHEHSGVGIALRLSASTLERIVKDVAQSLDRAGIRQLVLVNGHGGNYVLSNVVQEANEYARRMTLFPGRADWDRARRDAGLATTGHDDMHAGELETSLLLQAHPELVRPTFASADHLAPDRPYS
jgi:creatinine amidohydrolase